MRSGKLGRPPVSVIICAYNRYDETMACIDSVRRNTDPGLLAEIVLVDDASTERGLVDLVGSGGLQVVHHRQNTGFLDAANDGASVASGRYLFFLNNDAVVTPAWLEPLLERIEQPNVGAVGSKLVYPDGRLQEAGGVIFSDGSGWNLGRGGDKDDPRVQLSERGRLLQRRGPVGAEGPVRGAGRLRPGLRARLLRGSRLLLLSAKPRLSRLLRAPLDCRPPRGAHLRQRRPAGLGLAPQEQAVHQPLPPRRPLAGRSGAPVPARHQPRRARGAPAGPPGDARLRPQGPRARRRLGEPAALVDTEAPRGGGLSDLVLPRRRMAQRALPLSAAGDRGRGAGPAAGGLRLPGRAARACTTSSSPPGRT